MDARKEKATSIQEMQLSFFDEQPKQVDVKTTDNTTAEKIMKKLKKINISGTTPLEALQLLYELQNEIEK